MIDLVHGVWPQIRMCVGTTHLVLTDPPYGGIVDTETFEDTMSCDTLLRDLQLYSDILLDGGSALIWGGVGKPGDGRPFLSFLSSAEDAVPTMKLRNLLTWRKRRAYGKSNDYLFIREECAWFVKGDKPCTFHIPLTNNKRGYAGFDPKHPAKSEFLRVGNVIDDINEIFRGKRHPCEKPIALIQRMVETHSNPGDMVFDPYAGSGTTGEACHHAGRNCVLIEQNESTYQIARARIDRLSQGVLL